MGRLIDADVLKEYFFRPYSNEESYSNIDIGHIIDDQPTVNSSAQPELCLDSIVSEIEKTISETRESGKHHDINIRTNGAMICFGLQLALEIIEEKRNERLDIQTGGD